MATRMGLLLTMTEPRPKHEEEFNAWYDTEHMGERLAIPGFLSGRRWVRDCEAGAGRYLGARRFRASSGAPRHLALYDLVDGGVVEQPAWKAAGETEWARRIDALIAGCERVRGVFRAYP